VGVTVGMTRSTKSRRVVRREMNLIAFALYFHTFGLKSYPSLPFLSKVPCSELMPVALLPALLVYNP